MARRKRGRRAKCWQSLTHSVRVFVKSIYAEPDIDVGKGFLKMQINNVSQVKTIDRVARDLGEDLGLPHDVPLETEVEDGVIWVYGVDDDGVLAFTDFGVESLVELIKIRKESAESKHT